MNDEQRTLMHNGLWKNNPALVQILGLCPLLAVSNNTINALGLGIATLFVLILSNTLVAATRHWVRSEIRIPVFVLLIASAVTIAETLIQAFAYPLYQALGIYLALIVTNCAIIARAEAYAVKNSVPMAALDGAFMGVGFMWVLVLLGAMREILSQGTILAGADRLFGEGVDLTISVMNLESGIILAALPAGAFIGYGLLIAAKNAIDHYSGKRRVHLANPYTKTPTSIEHEQITR
ncbi:electron transport complex subunit E [Suttonella sp. R2A3]|uniref:electron transport complex subunit E n=1 Tax=Suttonella sp. R2A3 TaxID=2908648 RepID=UPI001F28B9BB|nr:electron transport complex subunit E [Suttonella sp. R2A3]UJF24281.1 electron transport complex subunit E [Suttonella sp. R2A3]